MRTTLFNPFKRYQAEKLIGVGLIFTVIGSVLAWLFNSRFDGIIDMHSFKKVALYQPFVDNAINIVLLLAVLFVIGKMQNHKTRFIDILAICLVARTPLYITPLFNIHDFMARAAVHLEAIVNRSAAASEPLMMTLFILFSILELLAIIWYLVLLYRGYKVSANTNGTLGISLFVTAMILAEIASKFIFYNIKI